MTFLEIHYAAGVGAPLHSHTQASADIVGLFSHGVSRQLSLFKMKFREIAVLAVNPAYRPRHRAHHYCFCFNYLTESHTS
jgi:hypothetical protein